MYKDEFHEVRYTFDQTTQKATIVENKVIPERNKKWKVETVFVSNGWTLTRQNLKPFVNFAMPADFWYRPELQPPSPGDIALKTAKPTRFGPIKITDNSNIVFPPN